MERDADFSIKKLLDRCMTTGKYSHGIASEIESRLMNRSTNIFMITNELAAMERAAMSRETRTKQAEEFKRRPLKGLWHKHHLHSHIGSMAKNIENHWKKNPGKLKFSIPEGLDRESLWKLSGFIGHRIVMGGYQERSDARSLTGEWIVFAKHEGHSYYLTLGSHLEKDQDVWSRCKQCAEQFPELSILQGG